MPRERRPPPASYPDVRTTSAGTQTPRPATTKLRSDIVTRHRTAVIDGLSVFYREAGDPGNPKLLLLGGFPASSHQFRNLIPALADRFHVLSPDYPGFGNT